MGPTGVRINCQRGPEKIRKRTPADLRKGRMKMDTLRVLSLAFVCGLVSTPALAQLPTVDSNYALATYRIIEIPLPASNCTQANAMNNLGDVVGTTGDCSRAFFYQHSSGAVIYLTF